MIIILSSCHHKLQTETEADGASCRAVVRLHVSFCIIVSLYHHNLAQTLYHPLLSLAEGQFSDIKATTADELAVSK